MHEVLFVQSCAGYGTAQLFRMSQGRLAVQKQSCCIVPRAHTWRGRAWNPVEARWYYFVAMEAPKQKQKMKMAGIELAKSTSLIVRTDRDYNVPTAHDHDTHLTETAFRLYIYRYNHSIMDAKQTGRCPNKVRCHMRLHIRQEISFRA